MKQEKFIVEYVKSGDVTRSAIKAGYSKKTAKAIGSENLSILDKEIRAYKPFFLVFSTSLKFRLCSFFYIYL